MGSSGVWQGHLEPRAESGKGSRQVLTNFITITITMVTPLTTFWIGKVNITPLRKQVSHAAQGREVGQWSTTGRQLRQGSRGMVLMVVPGPGKDTTGPKQSIIVVDERINVGVVSGPLVKATPQQ